MRICFEIARLELAALAYCVIFEQERAERAVFGTICTVAGKACKQESSCSQAVVMSRISHLKPIHLQVKSCPTPTTRKERGEVLILYKLGLSEPWAAKTRMES